MKITFNEANGLSAFFYLLARDHLPIGKINDLMEQATVFTRGEKSPLFSDPELESWADVQVSKFSETCIDITAPETD